MQVGKYDTNIVYASCWSVVSITQAQTKFSHITEEPRPAQHMHAKGSENSNAQRYIKI
jgi:hypothetical protein